MYSNHAEYFQYLSNLLGTYNIDKKKISGLSLVGFTVHALSDINDTVSYNSRNAIRESHVMTANKLDSLYKHAREVDILPTMSVPATMDFILIISEDDFKRVSEIVNQRTKTRRYVIDKANYIMVGDFIYSFNYDVEINVQEVEDGQTIEFPYMTARYREDIYNELPESLKTYENKNIKVVRRKTQRGWEYHLYITLRQFSREVYEKEFIDRDYSAYNFTANGEIVDIKTYRVIPNPKAGQVGRTELDLKMYFETSRTTKDSIYIQYESSNSFNLIHKSQDNGFRPLLGEKILTYIYTTGGARGNFRYAKQRDESIKFVSVDNDLRVNVYLSDGISRGGRSFGDSRESLRQKIITKKSTRNSIMTENDLLMQINYASKNNEHHIIKYRNDIVRIFNVFTTLKHTSGGQDFVIPANTIDVKWNIADTNILGDIHSSVSTVDAVESSPNEKWYNLNTFLVECKRPGYGELVPATFKRLLRPLMEEYRLGVSKPVYNSKGDAIIVDDKEVPVLHPKLKVLKRGVDYFYNNRIYTALVDKEDLREGEAIAETVLNVKEGVDPKDATYTTDDTIYYWLPYYMSYVRSDVKNFIKVYDQTIDRKNDLSYNLNQSTAPYTFICNWMRQSKDSIFNPYYLNINVRNNLTNYSLVDNGFIVKDEDGFINTNKLQVYLILEDNTTGNVVYANKFSLREYIALENSNDDYLDMAMILLPAGYIPRIVDNKVPILADYLQQWVDVPVTNLKATIKIYHITSPTNKNGESTISSTTFIPHPNGNDTRTVNLENPETGKVEEVEQTGINVKMYKDVVYDGNTNYSDEEFLVNYFSIDVMNIFDDMTDMFKPQHSMISTNEIRVHALPMVQYTFYKYYAALYKRALEEEYHIFNYVHRFQGEFSLSLKFTNTYGYSEYYTIGKERRDLNNVQLDMSFLVKYSANDVDIDPQDISEAIATYVKEINFMNFDVFHISKLYDYVMNSFSGSIQYLEFVSLNGNLSDNQLIEMKTSNIKNDTIIEKINVPYVYDAGRFKHSITWKVVKENKK